MKILHIISNLGQGGAQATLYRLVKASCGDTRHVVVSMMDEAYFGPRLLELGVEVKTLQESKGRLSLRGLGRLRDIIKTFEPDAVQTWMYHADLVGGVMARLSGCRAVFWGIRHSNLDPAVDSRSTLWSARACARLSRWIPARIVSCSAAAAKVHEEIGYAGEKIVVIPNGYDFSELKRSDAERSLQRERLGLDPSTPVLGMVARYHPQKDHKMLIDALAKVRESGVEFRCLLIGENMTDDNLELREALRKAGIEADVRLMGPRDDVPSLMNALDVHVLSSCCGEAFPNVLAEAMACGTPCVSTDVGDAAMIVGDTGRIVAPGDASAFAKEIMALVSERADNDQAWQRRRAASQERAEMHFSVDRMVSAYKRLWSAGFAARPQGG